MMRGRFSKSGMGGGSFFAFQDIITGTAGFLIVIAVFLALGLDQVVGISDDNDPGLISESDLNPLLAEIARLKAEVGQLQVLPFQDETSLRRIVEELKASVAQLSQQPSSSATPLTTNLLDHEAQIEREKYLTKLQALETEIQKSANQLRMTSGDLIAMEQRAKDAEALLQQSRDRQNVLRLIPERGETTKEPILVLVTENSFVVQSFDGTKAEIARSHAALAKSLSALTPLKHYVVFYFKPSGAHHFAPLTKLVRSSGFEIGYDLIPEILELEPVNSSAR